MNKKECALFLNQLFSHDVADDEKRLLLLDYTNKDSSIEEIVYFIRLLHSRMKRFSIPNRDNLIDTCGTGGDGKNTFNISTAVSFVVAAAGIPVVKHGNRAASGKCGSADILEALGANIYLSLSDAKRIFDKIGIVFLFAPLYHPHFKTLAPIRKSLMGPTIFNYLGPFLNPALPARQLIGVSDKTIAHKLAIVASKLNYTHLVIASSYDGIDEVSLSAPTSLFEIKGKNIQEGILYPSDYGFKTVKMAALQTHDMQENIAIMKAVLRGNRSPHIDIVTLNAGVAFYAVGVVDSIQSGIERAKKTINSSNAYLLLNRFIHESNAYEKYTG